MSVTFDKTKLLSNIKRQTLRLERRLNLPKNQAHELLANHFYNEISIADVRREISNGNYEGRIFLAAVSPDASKEILEKFVESFGEIVVSLSQSSICEAGEIGINDLVLEVFSLDSEVITSIGKN